LMLIQQWFKRKRLMNWQDFVGRGMKLLKCKFDHHITYLLVGWWVVVCVQQGNVALCYILLIFRMWCCTLNQIFNKSYFWNPDFKPVSLQYELIFLIEFNFIYIRPWVHILAYRLANRTQFLVVFLSPSRQMLG
jgi:hypothetical protein